MHVHLLLYAIHPWLTWPGFPSLLIAGAAAMAALAFGHSVRDARWPRGLIGFGVAVVLGLAVLQGAIAALYLIFPSYLDWVEPGAAAIAWLVREGKPAYPAIGSGDLYAQVYGPLLFQITGFFLGVLGPSIVVSKIPALGAFAATQFLTYAALRRFAAPRPLALTLVAAQCVIAAGFTNQSVAFGVRADPWLILLNAAATLLAVTGPTPARAALFGAVTGLAANFKLDAVLYEAPLAIFVLSRDEAAPMRLQLALCGLAGGVVALALPYINANAAHYLAILELSSHRSLDRWLVEKNIVMMVFLLLPAAWIQVFHRPVLARPVQHFFAATVIAMLVILYPASKDGAGPYHYLPFLPSLCLGVLMSLRAAQAGTPGRAALPLEASLAALLLALVLGYGPIVAQAWNFTLSEYGKAPALKEAIADLDAILDAHPHMTAAIGPGRNPAVNLESLRVIPVFRGNPLPIDPVTWSDDQTASPGVRDAVAVRLLRECRVDLWLLPRGEPFTSSLGDVMFRGAMLREFRDDYQLTASGTLFEQWQCNHQPGLPIGLRQ